WLLDPEWQVLTEERTLTRQLREWSANDVKLSPEEARMRFDFLALADTKRLVVVEIKRTNHAVTLEELQRLETYKERLALGTDKDVSMLLVGGGPLTVTPSTKKSWEQRDDGNIVTWGSIHNRTRAYYDHYKAVLEGDIDHPDFSKK